MKKTKFYVSLSTVFLMANILITGLQTHAQTAIINVDFTGSTNSGCSDGTYASDNGSEDFNGGLPAGAEITNIAVDVDLGFYVFIGGGNGDFNFYLNGTLIGSINNITNDCTSGSFNASDFSMYDNTSTNTLSFTSSGGYGIIVIRGVYLVTLTVSYTSCTPPTAFNMTGTGGYCAGTGGREVGLDGSETGVSYQLYVGGSTPVGSPVAGDGNPISFGNQTAGTYTAVGTADVGGCSNNMNGSAVVTENPLPVADVTATTDVTCYGGNDGTITVTGSDGTEPYEFSIDNGGSYESGADPTTYTFEDLVADTEYEIRVKDSNGCESPEIP
jgi:hypothetical protein